MWIVPTRDELEDGRARLDLGLEVVAGEQLAFERGEEKPGIVPTVGHLTDPAVQAAIVREVEEQCRPTQLELGGITERPNIAAVVARTSELVTQQTIGIPRILVVPKGDVKSGFKPFEVNLDTLRYPPASEDLWVQYLRTGGTETLAVSRGGIEEKRLEDYIVSGLMDFDDISYDDHADLLYDLAAQTVRHFKTYLSEDEAGKVLRRHRREIAKFIHAQMQEHYWKDAIGYEVKISKGFTELKRRAYTQAAGEPMSDFRHSPPDKSNMARYLFTGFSRSLQGEPVLSMMQMPYSCKR